MIDIVKCSRLRRGFAILLTALLIIPCQVHGDDPVVRAEYTLKTPRSREPVLGGSRETVVFTAWLPGGVETIRGVVCNPFSKGDAVGKHWAAMCRHWRFAYLQMDYDAVKRDEFVLIKTALADLAKKSGHPELEHAPLCFTGMSRGGGMSMNLAELIPERTIACVPVCLEVGPASEAARAIPVMTIFGEKDGSQMEKLLAKLPAERKQDARFGIAVQWGRRHEFALANNLSFIFLDEVIAKRVGDKGLAAVPLADGWLGDPSTWSRDGKRAVIAPVKDFQGAADNACWLPSRRVAAVWQAFVSASPDVTLSQPPGLGDKQAFQLHPSDTPIAVKVQVSPARQPKSIELWDADRRLDERTAAPWNFEVSLPAGVHSLYAVLREESGDVMSRPHTILVEPKR